MEPKDVNRCVIQVNHLMAGADTDVNGVLSFEEILDNHDLFVGSEVNHFCIQKLTNICRCSVLLKGK
jgi:hypothetical protein